AALTERGTGRRTFLQLLDSLGEAHMTQIVERWGLEALRLSGEGAFQECFGFAQFAFSEELGAGIEKLAGCRRWNDFGRLGGGSGGRRCCPERNQSQHHDQILPQQPGSVSWQQG